MPWLIVFRLNGGGDSAAGDVRRVFGGATSGENVRAEGVLAQVQTEPLDPRTVDLEDLDVDDDFGARLVVGADQSSR